MSRGYTGLDGLVGNARLVIFFGPMFWLLESAESLAKARTDF
jgi:hypothetical protein